jgi:chemotaxis protein MotB
MQELHEEKPEGAPEWMVSYADMITIIMSFFVIMFALASGEAAKGKQSQQAAIDSFQYRFGPQWKPFMSWSVSPGNSQLPGGGKGQGSTAPTPAVGDPGGTVHVAKKEKARIRVKGQGELIAIGGMVNFHTASTELAPVSDKFPTLETIAEELAGKPQQVEIVATASNRPLPPGCLFHDRWELGYARCRRVAELLTALKIDPKHPELKIEPERLRLSVIPARSAEDSGEQLSEADVGVQVNLSTTLPVGAK